MDTSKPVVRLCIEGMKAESEGRLDDARRLFLQAWRERRDNLDACIAAHYIARHQETPEDELHWNLVALDQAKAAHDEDIQDFFPSLYLNLGWSNESLGKLEEARTYYRLAAECIRGLPAGSYRDTVQQGITGGLERTSAHDR